MFVDRWRDSYLRPNLLTNSAVDPSLDVIDLVVLAGTPEWFGRPVERIYRELLRFPDVPLVAIGVGGTGPGFEFAPHEREIFQRENSLIICRNPVLAREANEQLGSEKAILLPCPAFFSSPADTPRTPEDFARTLPAINVQGDTVENQSAPAAFVDRLRRYVEELEEVSETRFVAHYIDEFLRFSRLNPRASIFYSYEPLDYIEHFRDQTRALLASRLHGGIASLSSGTPAGLFDFGSDRLNDAASPFGGLLPCFKFDDAIEWIRSQTPESCAERSRAIMNFKKTTLERYLGILGPFLERYVPEVVEMQGGAK